MPFRFGPLFHYLFPYEIILSQSLHFSLRLHKPHK
jgi:hypothetical protein